MERKLIGAAAVREMCGGVSDMSIWRWLDDPELQFPKPIYISRRRYWGEADLLAWIDSRETDQTQPSAKTQVAA